MKKIVACLRGAGCPGSRSTAELHGRCGRDPRLRTRLHVTEPFPHRECVRLGAQILNHGGAAAGVQTLLFSATLPSWVRDITKRFLQPGFKTVDLVGTDKMKARPACASRRP
jgi:hypothetical protein